MGRAPPNRRAAIHADNRLTLELNCQSEDVESSRRSKRDGGHASSASRSALTA